MAPKSNNGETKASTKSKWGEKFSEDYYQKRERNNDAVRKSRQKSRQRAKEVKQKVKNLKDQNTELESKVLTLGKELSVLQDLFMAHAEGVHGGAKTCPIDPPLSPVNEEALTRDHKYATSPATTSKSGN